MILYKNNVFYLETELNSYILRVDETKHIVNEYYGSKVSNNIDPLPIFNKWTYGFGNQVIYDKEINPLKSLDLSTLELSTTGKGDFNEPSLILKNKDGYIFDFLYDSYLITNKITKLKKLPTPHDGDQELIIFLKDKINNIDIEMHYIVFYKANVIARNIIIKNNSGNDLFLLKCMSSMLVLNNDNYEVLSLYGTWSNECKREYIDVKHTQIIIDSKTGASSNRHNPFFMVKNKEATFNNGNVYAFNLIYSGNHYSSIEENHAKQVRIMSGISPLCFEYKLKSKETFETPFSVSTFSNKGINKASQNMHYFINNHVINGVYKNKIRPILINNWEATGANFNENKILKIAKTAKECGIELFVLDDGWFKGRNGDTGGLGDYEVDKKKLPHSLSGLAKKINKLGLDFGLWFEPEMINENSNLYRNHKDYVLKHPLFKASEGRHQLCLDLTKKEVQDYIIQNVSDVLKSANIKYVKWDYNRSISDFYIGNGLSGNFFYDYIVGFYRILSEITNQNKNVLFEGCSSGGNRFDLGVLSYFQQNWASDNTDAYDRNYIQSGLYLGYPLSTIGAHVSATPSHSSLRITPIETRFNVAAFGVLGYELDLNHLTKLELNYVKEQIKFYKKHRKLFQYGTFYQFSFMEKENHSEWMVLSEDKKEALIGYFNGVSNLMNGVTILKGADFIPEQMYSLEVRRQKHNIKVFGGLINTILPIRLNENGFIVNEISKHKDIEIENEKYLVDGRMLNSNAIKLKQEWNGTGFDDGIRLLGDFGSRIYHIKSKEIG